jgi:hypothetical protein
MSEEEQQTAEKEFEISILNFVGLECLFVLISSIIYIFAINCCVDFNILNYFTIADYFNVSIEMFIPLIVGTFFLYITNIHINFTKNTHIKKILMLVVMMVFIALIIFNSIVIIGAIFIICIILALSPRKLTNV